MLNISDEETIHRVTENLYIQYFLGCDIFTSKPPFDSSLFVEIRKRLGMEQLNKINDEIIRPRFIIGQRTRTRPMNPLMMTMTNGS